MPAIPPAFQAALMQLESSPPGDRMSFANGWADAFFKGFGSPTPPSATGAAAKQAAFGIFLGAYEGDAPSGSPVGLPVLKAGAAAFMAALALGMLPAFAAVPPSGPCPTWDQFASVGDNTTSKGIMPGLMTAATVQWYMGGTATNVSSGVTVPWS